MWIASGKPVDADRFSPFDPEEILYEFDGPRIFTLRDVEGDLNLVCWSDEEADVSQFIVVPTTEQIIKKLKHGEMAVLDALNQPRCWVCDVRGESRVRQCFRIDFDAIPRDSLPAPGVLLLPTLQSPPSSIDGGNAIVLEGRIRELDKDHMSFELREIEGQLLSQRFMFDKGLLNEVSQAFQDDARVRVAGRPSQVRNLAYALKLSRFQPNEG